METPILTLPDVVGYILDRATENDLARIDDARRVRRRRLQGDAAAAVVVGTTVTITEISPKYLCGLVGTVTDIVAGRVMRRATVTLTKQSTNALGSASSRYRFLLGRDSYDLTGVPLGCCRVVTD